jgi:hypothetical protein
MCDENGPIRSWNTTSRCRSRRPRRRRSSSSLSSTSPCAFWKTSKASISLYSILFYSLSLLFSSLLFFICIAHVIRRPGQVLARRSGLR